MICRTCGKTTSTVHLGRCQSCYNYFHRGGVVHPLPAPGTIQRNASGKVICHICGRTYTCLGSHVKKSHAMSVAEYKAMFGLCRTSKTTEAGYSNTMRCLAIEHGMDRRILEVGAATRIKPGQTDMRSGKPVRLQEILDKRNRHK